MWLNDLIEATTKTSPGQEEREFYNEHLPKLLLDLGLDGIVGVSGVDGESSNTLTESPAKAVNNTDAEKINLKDDAAERSERKNVTTQPTTSSTLTKGKSIAPELKREGKRPASVQSTVGGPRASASKDIPQPTRKNSKLDNMIEGYISALNTDSGVPQEYLTAQDKQDMLSEAGELWPEFKPPPPASSIQPAQQSGSTDPVVASTGASSAATTKDGRSVTNQKSIAALMGELNTRIANCQVLMEKQRDHFIASLYLLSETKRALRDDEIAECDALAPKEFLEEMIAVSLAADRRQRDKARAKQAEAEAKDKKNNEK
ncbi:hypothetical protein PVAG01_07516 [Phlyctema vagabunda]|uniref:Uncharacterized protein n=1 Tax=Phlyctema vagabunda TaxID=108571 RepID=A0ABR4PDF3_9HELO